MLEILIVIYNYLNDTNLYMRAVNYSKRIFVSF